ncbi:MAG: CinA family nicotinamide mononucleotide deamidase-related protein [Pseudomonadota bacterium]
MRCEIVAIGTELLLGQITDTNSSWIGEQLALAGIDNHFQIKVGDNLDRMIACLEQGLERADAVICCGGLGPTQDDITREAIASVMGVKLVRDDAIGEKIRHMFEARGRQMPENNLQQADVPEGAQAIKEMPGTAPGLLCPVGKKVIYAVPGVPYEMRMMMEGTILPDLKKRSGNNDVIRSRVLKTWGYSESRLAEMLDEHLTALDQSGAATIAFQASGIEGLKVRVTAKAADDGSADQILAIEETRVREVLGDVIFGVNEQSMESVVLDLLRAKHQTLALCEITSGGMVATRINGIDNTAEVVRGTLVPTDENARVTLLGEACRTVGSPDAAAALATATRELFQSDWALAITGAHDTPMGTAKKDGTTFLGIANAEGSNVEMVRLPGDRERVRQFSVISALNYLRMTLLGTKFVSL